MAYPKYAETMDEWWQFVDENWPNLKQMVVKFYPRKVDPLPDHDMVITAGVPEGVRKNLVIDMINKREMEPKDIAQYLELLRSNRSAASLHTIFGETWFGVPESIQCNSIPGFSILCDLCSDFPYEGGELE